MIVITILKNRNWCQFNSDQSKSEEELDEEIEIDIEYIDMQALDDESQDSSQSGVDMALKKIFFEYSNRDAS